MYMHQVLVVWPHSSATAMRLRKIQRIFWNKCIPEVRTPAFASPMMFFVESFGRLLKTCFLQQFYVEKLGVFGVNDILIWFGLCFLNLPWATLVVWMFLLQSEICGEWCCPGIPQKWSTSNSTRKKQQTHNKVNKENATMGEITVLWD